MKFKPTAEPRAVPQLDALVFTPVAAHMAFNRSLVLAADEPVSVRVLERSGRVAVSVDGQLRGVLDPGDWIRVYAGPKRARLVREGPHWPRTAAMLSSSERSLHSLAAASSSAQRRR